MNDANWQTFLYGGIRSILTAIVTGALTWPSDWHNPTQDALFACVLIATFFGISFAASAKNKNVTGGTIAQDEQGKVAMRPAIPPVRTHIKKL